MKNAVNVKRKQIVEKRKLLSDSEPETYDGDDELAILNNGLRRITYAFSSSSNDRYHISSSIFRLRTFHRAWIGRLYDCYILH